MKAYVVELTEENAALKARLAECETALAVREHEKRIAEQSARAGAAKLAKVERILNDYWQGVGPFNIVPALRKLFPINDGATVSAFVPTGAGGNAKAFVCCEGIGAHADGCTAVSASAVQPERCCLDYPRCDCNSPPEPDDDWLCFQRPAQPKVTP